MALTWAIAACSPGDAHDLSGDPSGFGGTSPSPSPAGGANSMGSSEPTFGLGSSTGNPPGGATGGSPPLGGPLPIGGTAPDPDPIGGVGNSPPARPGLGGQGPTGGSSSPSSGGGGVRTDSGGRGGAGAGERDTDIPPAGAGAPPATATGGARVTDVSAAGANSGGAASPPGGASGAGSTAAGTGEALRIEAEEYARYFDTTAGNAGGDYRTDDVDLQSCPESGFNVGWTAPGEWLEYDIELATTDHFILVARTGTPFGAPAGIAVDVDGERVGDWTDVPATAAWHDYTDVVIGSTTLAAGPHVVRISMNGDFALTYLVIRSATRPTPQNGHPDPGPAPSRPSGFIGAAERWGHLQVVDGQLRDETGTPVQLRGVSTHGLQWYPPRVGYTIPRLAYDWGVDVVRPAMYVEDYKDGSHWGGYVEQSDYMKREVVATIDDAIESGIYVIVDWHIHNDPTQFTTLAIDYFTEMAQRYGDSPNVIYEICNEPEYVSWDVVKQYANEVIPAIRQVDPDNLILVGTPNWCQDVHVVADEPLDAENVAYSLHFYAGAHGQWLRDQADYALGKGLPLFVSEWGTSNYSGGTDGLIYLAESDTWMNWVEDRGLSWINWSFSNKNETSAALRPGVSLAGPWDTAALSESGRYVRGRLQAARASLRPY